MTTINIQDFQNSYMQLLADADRYLQHIVSLEKKHKIDLKIFSRKPEISCCAHALVIEDNILKFQINYQDYEGYYLSEYYTDMPHNVSEAIENINSLCLQITQEKEELRKENYEKQQKQTEEKEKQLLKELQNKYPDI